MAKSGKKISHLQAKIGDTKEFYNRHFINRKKRLGLQRNLIFNQGIKNSLVFEVVVVGGGGERMQKKLRTSGKILATPLIRAQMID